MFESLKRVCSRICFIISCLFLLFWRAWLFAREDLSAPQRSRHPSFFTQSTREGPPAVSASSISVARSDLEDPPAVSANSVSASIPDELPARTTKSSYVATPVQKQKALARTANSGSEGDFPPGRCGAAFLEPPCDMFKLLDYDFKKWRDRSVHPKQVMTRRTERTMKCWLVGAIGDEIYLAFPKGHTTHRLGTGFDSMQVLVDLRQHAAVDVEMAMSWQDLPLVRRKDKGPCGASDDFVFSTSSHPDYCDVSLPSGYRPPRTLLDDQVAYEQKVNKAFWRGSIGPSARCGGVAEKSPRVKMVKASLTKYGGLINASFCNMNQSKKVPKSLIKTFRPHCTPFSEQFKYRFLPASAPACTYTGRLLQFVQSNSIVAKFGYPAEYGAQPLHAGLQDNVHALLLKPDRWEEQLEVAQRSWKRLGQIPRNARAYSRWALNRTASDCYLLTVISGYLQKLAYDPGAGGNLVELLKRRRSGQRVPYTVPYTTSNGQKPLIEGIMVETLTYGGEEFTVYSKRDPAAGRNDRLRLAEATGKLCAEAMATKPVYLVYDASEGRWKPKRGA